MDPALKDFLFSNALEGIVVTDRDGNILECNHTVEKILGYRREEILGEFTGILFPSSSTAYLLSNLMRLVLLGNSFDGEILLESAFGEAVMVRMHAEAWHEQGSDRIVFRFLDWREVNGIVQQLRNANQMAALGALTRSMAHEILNPVSVIGGFTRRLLRELAPDSPREEWARQVMAGVDKLEAMIDTLQTFLNLPQPRFSPVSLSRLLDTALDNIRGLAVDRGIDIRAEGRREFSETYLDPELVVKALRAILLNAMDRMPQGGSLTLAKEQDDTYLILRIHDTGPEPDSRQMEEDLSPIRVVGDNLTHLNLAIARRIVEDHDGRLELGISPAGGLVVHVLLPVDRRSLERTREA